MTAICEMCGKPFVKANHNHRFCSKKCQLRKAGKKEKPKPSAPRKDILTAAREAEAHGMSYGKYVAYSDGRIKV